MCTGWEVQARVCLVVDPQSCTAKVSPSHARLTVAGITIHLHPFRSLSLSRTQCTTQMVAVIGTVAAVVQLVTTPNLLGQLCKDAKDVRQAIEDARGDLTRLSKHLKLLIPHARHNNDDARLLAACISNCAKRATRVRGLIDRMERCIERALLLAGCTRCSSTVSWNILTSWILRNKKCAMHSRRTLQPEQAGAHPRDLGLVESETEEPKPDGQGGHVVRHTC